MTEPTLATTATLRDLFFEAGSTTGLQDSAPGTLANSIPGNPALTDAVKHDFAGSMEKLLSHNLADVVVEAWKCYGAVMDAARHTRDNPGSVATVQLMDHKLVSDYRPDIEMLVNNRSVATFRIGMHITTALHAAVVTIEQGCLTRVRVARCVMSGSLSIQEHTFAERKCDFDLPGAVRFRRGIPLLGDVSTKPLMMQPQ